MGRFKRLFRPDQHAVLYLETLIMKTMINDYEQKNDRTAKTEFEK